MCFFAYVSFQYMDVNWLLNLILNKLCRKKLINNKNKYFNNECLNPKLVTITSIKIKYSLRNVKNNKAS